MAEPIIFASLCKSATPCVEMTLNHGENFKAGTVEEIEGGTLHLFEVKGRLNEGPVKVHKVEFFANKADMECTDFTQGNVAVSGWTKEGPILQTYQGNLHVLGGELRVGCENCLKIKEEETQKTLASFTSPSWDLSLTDTKAEDISYDDENKAYILRINQCLELPIDGMIKKTDLQKCVPTENVGHASLDYKNFQLESAQWLYKRAGLPKVAFLSMGACS